jgi:predicted nuclease of restriction endonuclease-like (RecB) superfamily
MEPLAPHSYAQFLADLKSRIRAAQVRASLAVNRELVLPIGRLAATSSTGRIVKAGGAKIIDRLATDLKRAFPDMKGFSPRNLKYMRRPAEAWTEAEFVQQVAAQLPWFHNCVLLDKVSEADKRRWYARATLQHGWSRAPCQSAGIGDPLRFIITVWHVMTCRGECIAIH